LETVLKGLEIPLPAGHGVADKDGNPRQHIRTRWWNTQRLSYRELAIVPPEVISQIPHTPAPDDILPGYKGDKPLFVGHYWMTGEPESLTAHIACLDYSIAGQNKESATPGKLCAYRLDKERELQKGKFIWVNG